MTQRRRLPSNIHPSTCSCRTCAHQRQPGLPTWLPDVPTSIAMIIVAVGGIAINLIQFS